MSINRIRGDGGVIIDSQAFLELPKAPTKITPDVIRSGMIRYNGEWKSFEGVLDFDDGTVAYRRFANLDANGKLLTSQLPDSVTSGLQFLGTYAPISDDIDPPTTQVALPAPDVSLNGDYYVVRGIMDAAQIHYEQNLPTSSPVVFTPVNPTGEGDWTEIIYYIDKNPIDPSTQLVSAAFGRIIDTNIPATGHEGLASLATDPQLTTPFDTTLTPQGQTALADGDWVIITEDKNIRLRQSRTSITASSVLYDNTVMIASKRPYSTNAGTVQTTLDNITLEGLRRTGDSMVDDGGIGEGRFGIMYGTATEPSMAFNNAAFDPTDNPGNDPSKWTDTNTGIFHPADKTIGFSTNGVERVRITNSTLSLYQVPSNVATNPVLRFEGNNNTNTGISGVSNIISFSTMNKTQVEFKDSLSAFHGAITVDGGTTLTGVVTMGNNMSVAGTSDLNGNTNIGDASTDILTVKATSTFTGDSNFNGVNKFKNLNLLENGTLTLESATNQSTVKLVSSVLQFNMGDFADFTILDNGIERAKINRYGFKTPVLVTVDDAVGEDGMIAYSSTNKTTMQKVDGTWLPIGTGRSLINEFTLSDWVLDGERYSYTVAIENVLSVDIQEAIVNATNTDYSKVEVDQVLIKTNSVVIYIPATPDVRFNGRLIVNVIK